MKQMYVIVDIETTGGSAKSGKITEVAFYRHDGFRIVDEFVSLVNPETFISSFITELTGITNQMVSAAPKFYEIAKRVVEITQDAIFVAHNASFDYGFIKEEFRQLGYDFERSTICTVKLSRKLLPGYASYSLGKLCDALAINISARHRASGDALATVKLFEILIDSNFGWLDLNNPYKVIEKRSFNKSLDTKQLSQLEEGIGVITLYNSKNELIYIKSSLHTKLSIWKLFVQPQLGRMKKIIPEIVNVENKITGCYITALIEENRLNGISQIFNKGKLTRKDHIGLFSYMDRAGYHRLYLDTIKGIQAPLYEFISRSDAQEYLMKWVVNYNLCSKLCGLDKENCCHSDRCHSESNCVLSDVLVCDYNLRVSNLFSDLNYKHPNMIIIKENALNNKSSIVLIENYCLVGNGYIDSELRFQNTSDYRKYIEFQEETRLLKQSIIHILETSTEYKVIPIEPTS